MGYCCSKQSEDEKKKRQKVYNKLFTQKYTKGRRFIFEDRLCSGKEPTTTINDDIFYLDDILNTKPIEKLHPQKVIILNSQKSNKENQEPMREQKFLEQLPDSRKQVENTLYPYCCIGVVTGKIGEYCYYGTGCLISSKIVLTCAHNVFSRQKNSEFRNIKFTPAVNGEHGRVPVHVKKCHYPPEYQNLERGESQYDFAVLQLEENLEETYGYLGIDTRKQNAKVEEVEVCGYPNDKIAHTMWHSFGPCESQTFLKYKIPAKYGQSGSPIIKRENGKEYVIGIHIGSDSELKWNMGIQLTPLKRKMINEWLGPISESLNLGGKDLEDKAIKYLGREKWLTKLTSLDLKENMITSKGLEFLSQAKLENLKELDLAENQINDDGVIYLSRFPKLVLLDISFNKITREGVQTLGECEFPHLQELYIRGIKMRNELRFLLKFKTLQALSLWWVGLTENGLQILNQGQFPNLRELRLGRNSIGDQGLQFLHKFTTLELLYLNENKITEKGVQILSFGTFPYLKKLNLNSNAIADHGLKFFQKLMPTLKFLDLEDNKITEKGVQVLWQIILPSLQELWLRGNKIDEKGKDMARRIKKQKNIHVLYNYY